MSFIEQRACSATAAPTADLEVRKDGVSSEIETRSEGQTI